MKNILLVDDDGSCLDVLAEGLREQGDRWNVMTAENGEQAADILASQSVDLVVTDLRMPVMDGYGLLDFVKKRQPDMPVIVMTADDSREVQQRLRLRGITQCLAKPVNIYEIRQMIANQFAMPRNPVRT